MGTSKNIKWAVNLAASILGFGYGIWLLLVRMPYMIFVLGDHDTALEIIGILAYGLCPIVASVLALFRHRRLAALFFAAAATLWFVGNWDEAVYMHHKFGNPISWRELALDLTSSSGVLMLFALFYITTDMMAWPAVRPRPTT